MTSDPSGQLLSLLSHELRSPLGVIRGYLRMLDEPSGSLTAQQRQAVAAAMRAADQAAHLLGQASFLAQLRRGETQWNPSTVDVRALVEAASQSARTFDAPVTCVIGEIAVRNLAASPDQLRGALASFIAAVARAQVPPTPITITGLRRQHDDRDGLSLRIERPRDGSQPSERALNMSRGGLGLDLPIAEAIIAAHGGLVTELLDGGRWVGVVVWLPATS